MPMPLPELNEENRAFWTGGANGELLITACDDCDYRIHPPQLICPKCLSRSVSAKSASGLGRIYSYTVNHQAWLPDLEVPYVVGVVDLDDQPGVRVTARIVDCDPSSVAIGQAVKVDFEPRADVFVPVFRQAV